MKTSPLNHNTQVTEVGVADDKTELGGNPDPKVRPYDTDFVKLAHLNELHALFSIKFDKKKKKHAKLQTTFENLGSLNVKKLA